MAEAAVAEELIPVPEEPQISGRSPWALGMRRLVRNRSAMASLVLLLLIFVMSFAAPIYAHDIAHTDPFVNNLDGTTMCLALASVFVAQAAGIHMTFGQQLLMMLTLILSSKGVACVPRASLIVLLGTVATFGLPVEPVVMLLGIDELMDMGRSATNQIGNCLAAVVIAKSEGEFQLTPEELAPVDTARAS